MIVRVIRVARVSRVLRVIKIVRGATSWAEVVGEHLNDSCVCAHACACACVRACMCMRVCVCEGMWWLGSFDYPGYQSC